MLSPPHRGRRGEVVQVETRVESAWFQPVKVKYDKLLSGFAFNFNWRPHGAIALKWLGGWCVHSPESWSSLKEQVVVWSRPARQHCFYVRSVIEHPSVLGSADGLFLKSFNYDEFWWPRNSLHHRLSASTCFVLMLTELTVFPIWILLSNSFVYWLWRGHFFGGFVLLISAVLIFLLWRTRFRFAVIKAHALLRNQIVLSQILLSFAPGSSLDKLETSYFHGFGGTFSFLNDEVPRVITNFAGIPEQIFQHVFRFGVTISQGEMRWALIELIIGGKSA